MSHVILLTDAHEAPAYELIEALRAAGVKTLIEGLREVEVEVGGHVEAQHLDVVPGVDDDGIQAPGFGALQAPQELPRSHPAGERDDLHVGHRSRRHRVAVASERGLLARRLRSTMTCPPTCVGPGAGA
jgi:hypothetical protein